MTAAGKDPSTTEPGDPCPVCGPVGHVRLDPDGSLSCSNCLWDAPGRVLSPGDRVTWNDTGRSLFGDTGSEGLLVEVRNDYPGLCGPAGHVLWESGQGTWASISCLTRAEKHEVPLW